MSDPQPDPNQPDAEGRYDVDAAAEDFIADLERAKAEREEANSRYLRVLADFQNYQRRALQNEQAARAQGVADVVQGVITVVDHFDMALAQAPGAAASAEQVIAGVRLIRDELLKVLSTHGISLIQPAPGDAFAPGRHEAIMTAASPVVPDGAVLSLFQMGYAIRMHGIPERVLRPAKVGISSGPGQ